MHDVENVQLKLEQTHIFRSMTLSGMDGETCRGPKIEQTKKNLNRRHLIVLWAWAAICVEKWRYKKIMIQFPQFLLFNFYRHESIHLEHECNDEKCAIESFYYLSRAKCVLSLLLVKPRKLENFRLANSISSKNKIVSNQSETFHCSPTRTNWLCHRQQSEEDCLEFSSHR